MFCRPDPELLIHVQPGLRPLHHRPDDQVLLHVSLPLLRYLQDRNPWCAHQPDHLHGQRIAVPGQRHNCYLLPWKSQRLLYYFYILIINQRFGRATNETMTTNFCKSFQNLNNS